MSKLNYDRDVKPELKRANLSVKSELGKEYKIKNTASGSWQLVDEENVIIEGTLREIYNYILGMNHAFNIQ